MVMDMKLFFIYMLDLGEKLIEIFFIVLLMVIESIRLVWKGWKFII